MCTIGLVTNDESLSSAQANGASHFLTEHWYEKVM